jgi:hypothetical protein
MESAILTLNTMMKIGFLRWKKTKQKVEQVDNQEDDLVLQTMFDYLFAKFCLFRCGILARHLM